MFKSWGEIMFDIAIGTGLYLAGKKNGQQEAQRIIDDHERDKQIADLKRQIQFLKDSDRR